TDRDVHAWAEQWLRTTGVDTLTAEITAPEPAETASNGSGNGNGQSWALAVTRDGSRPHRITVGTYDHALGAQGGPGHLAPRDRFELDVPGDGTPTIRPGRRP
ncbi:aminopeptidase N, partial [Streptomyces sp. SID7499]|nr:aminopeptidase N [Streptomyces sp. SID7499]